NSLGDNTAWNISSFPSQGTANRTDGIQFTFNAVGQENITVAWEQRISGSASKYYHLQWSTNGASFIDYPTPVVMNNDSVFEKNLLNLDARLSNQPSVTVRIVSEWESSAIGTTNQNYATTGASYSAAGTARFDLMTIYSTAIVQ